jgi:hypothetical protein
MSKVNRNFKAGVFTHLFGDPEKELELYNAFSATPFPPDTPVIDLTLTDTLYMDRVNDLSFSVGGKFVVFFEHQASINENMALRSLLYCGRVYEKLIDNSAMYAESRVMIPTPEFYVLYNGIKPFPEYKEYHLSGSFLQPTQNRASLELTVTVYNVNKGFNEDIVSRSDHLHGYVSLIAKVRELERGGARREDALRKAIAYCVEHGVLLEYLTNNGSEVLNMLLQEWKIEDARAVWEKEAEERGEKRGEQRANRKWRSIVAEQKAALADKDATLAEQKAEIEKLRARSER